MSSARAPVFVALPVELEPLPVPQAVRAKATENRQVAAVSIPLPRIATETLDQLVSEWVAAVYAAHGKRPPDLRFPTRRTPIL